MKTTLAMFPVLFCIVAIASTEDEIMALYKQRVIAEYNRDMKSDSGRVKWYGKINKSIILTNDLRRIDIHSSGAIFTNKWTDAYAVKAKAYKKRTQIPPAFTNGVPKKLAAARLKRWNEKQAVSNATVTVRGN